MAVNIWYREKKNILETFLSSHRCPEVKALDKNKLGKVHSWRPIQKLKEGKKGALVTLKRSAYV